jgi:5-carboxymethyl-2-hydroxymuconate isomerase
VRNPYYQAALDNERQIQFELDGIASGVRKLNERIERVNDIRARYGSLSAYYRKDQAEQKAFIRVIRTLTRSLRQR